MKVVYNVYMKCWYSTWSKIDEYRYECKDIQDVASKVISTLEKYQKWSEKLKPSVKYGVTYTNGKGFNINKFDNINMAVDFRSTFVEKLDAKFEHQTTYIINGSHEPFAEVEYDSNLNLCDENCGVIKITVTCSIKEDN